MKKNFSQIYRFGNWAKKIAYGVFVTALFSIAGLFLASLLPIPGNIEVKIVKSGSMEPTIKTGAITIVKPSSSYAVGDIIMFGKDTKLEIPTTHRIIETKQENGETIFITKGDANEEADPSPVYRKDVLGKIIFSAPYIGFILDFAKKPLGFSLLIGVPALMIIIDEISKIYVEVRKMIRKRKDDDSDNEESNSSNGSNSQNIKTSYTKNSSVISGGSTFALAFEKALIDGIIPYSLIHTYEKLHKQSLRKSVGYKKKNSLIKTTSIVVSCSIFFVSLVSVGDTVSYFNDTEKSLENLFRASGVDIELSIIDSSSPALQTFDTKSDEIDSTRQLIGEIPTNSSSFSVALTEHNHSSEVLYTIEGKISDGNPEGCDALNLEASIETYTYQGLFKEFKKENMNNVGTWDFTLSLPKNNNLAPDTICTGDIIFKAYSKYASALAKVFKDEEIYSFSIKNHNEPELLQTFETSLVQIEEIPVSLGTSTEETLLSDPEQTEEIIKENETIEKLEPPLHDETMETNTENMIAEEIPLEEPEVLEKTQSQETQEIKHLTTEPTLESPVTEPNPPASEPTSIAE